MTTAPQHRVHQKISIIRKRDELVRGALFKAAKDKDLSKMVVLQGGNALHFMYSSPRHSHDLDFVLRTEKTSLTTAISMFVDVLAEDYETHKCSPNGPGVGVKPVERVKYTSPGSKIKGIVEIAGQIALSPVETKGVFAPLLVETPSEIFADKIVATLGRMKTRGSLKGTDLFDLLYIQRTLEVVSSPDEVVEKARTYSFIGWEKETLGRVIDFILSEENFPVFERDIRKKMMPDVSDVSTFGREFFERAAECFTHFYSVIG